MLTADLWFWKRPLYQLSHNHYPLNERETLTLSIAGLNQVWASPFWMLQHLKVPNLAGQLSVISVKLGCIIIFYKKEWANLGIFFFIFVLFKHKFYRKHCRLQRDSNLGYPSRRQARWPLDHHHSPVFDFVYQHKLFVQSRRYDGNNNFEAKFYPINSFRKYILFSLFVAYCR